MGILNVIGSVIKPLTGLVDDLHTSSEEKLELKQKLAAIEADLSAKALAYEQSLVAEQASIIRAEAQSDSWLTKNWRPLTMLFFLVIVGFAVFFGGVVPWTGQKIPEQYITEALSIVKIGLGGYVVGRSAEKIVPGVVQALKKKEE
jgi:hypothetical protein